MIISGALTCTMIYAVIDPEEALINTSGETISSPIAEIVVRNWGALITIIGAMLIFGAFKLSQQLFMSHCYAQAQGSGGIRRAVFLTNIVSSYQ